MSCFVRSATERSPHRHSCPSDPLSDAAMRGAAVWCGDLHARELRNAGVRERESFAAARPQAPPRTSRERRRVHVAVAVNEQTGSRSRSTSVNANVHDLADGDNSLSSSQWGEPEAAHLLAAQCLRQAIGHQHYPGAQFQHEKVPSLGIGAENDLPWQERPLQLVHEIHGDGASRVRVGDRLALDQDPLDTTTPSSGG